MIINSQNNQQANAIHTQTQVSRPQAQPAAQKPQAQTAAVPAARDNSGLSDMAQAVSQGFKNPFGGSITSVGSDDSSNGGASSNPTASSGSGSSMQDAINAMLGLNDGLLPNSGSDYPGISYPGSSNYPGSFTPTLPTQTEDNPYHTGNDGDYYNPHHEGPQQPNWWENGSATTIPGTNPADGTPAEKDPSEMTPYERFQSYDYDTQDLIIERMTENQCGYEDVIVVGNNKGADKIHVSQGDNGGLVVDINGEKTNYTAEEAKRLVIAGGEGCDLIEVDPNVTNNMAISGGAGRDTIQGGAGNDDLRGGDGNDNIYGMGGDDKIYGGRGENILYGGSGHDHYVLDDRDGRNDRIKVDSRMDMRLDSIEHIENNDALMKDTQNIVSRYVNANANGDAFTSVQMMAKYAGLMRNSDCDDDYRNVLCQVYSDVLQSQNNGTLTNSALMAQLAQVNEAAKLSGDYTQLIALVDGALKQQGI